MEVILLERIERLGQMGDVVQVRPGFARNFLFPQKKALRANKDNKAFFESKRAELEALNVKRRDEAQVVATVVSMDPDVDADIPAMIGASAALALSGAPFNGPIGAARVGYKDGKYLLNPTASELKASDLHLVVAGTKDGVMMVESEADQLSEDVMLGAVVYGHEQMQAAINAIEELAEVAGKPAWD